MSLRPAIPHLSTLPKRSLRAILMERRAPRRYWQAWRQSLWAWALSAVVHAALIVALALVVERLRLRPDPPAVVARQADAEPLLEGLPIDAPLDIRPNDRLPTEAPSGVVSVETPQLATLDRPQEAAAPVAETGIPAKQSLLLPAGERTGGGLDGRAPGAREDLVKKGGGNDRSEEAVRRGLRWLAAHQSPDGGWRFDHQTELCQGMCRNPGSNASTTGATALALLPFLGAGHTHVDGEYRDVVRNGFYYLTGHMLATPQGGDFQEGTMYAQGLSAMALSEAYALSRDPNLRDYAQRSLDFIVYAQDQRGGGWRYAPGQPGDTTVTGWQLLALKSGRMAQLHVPTLAIADAQRFLDSVQSKGGAAYGYLVPGGEPTTTAVGLLCRMVTGWPREHRALVRGVDFLDRTGPSKDNMYFNYYATQVLHHWGSYPWERWNGVMRDQLIATQSREGHESGSWFFTSNHSNAGGRLYNTAMAVMTLEVYYRYLPLYQTDRLDDEF